MSLCKTIEEGFGKLLWSLDENTISEEGKNYLHYYVELYKDLYFTINEEQLDFNIKIENNEVALLTDRNILSLKNKTEYFILKIDFLFLKQQNLKIKQLFDCTLCVFCALISLEKLETLYETILKIYEDYITTKKHKEFYCFNKKSTFFKVWCTYGRIKIIIEREKLQ